MKQRVGWPGPGSSSSFMEKVACNIIPDLLFANALRNASWINLDCFDAKEALKLYHFLRPVKKYASSIHSKKREEENEILEKLEQLKRFSLSDPTCRLHDPRELIGQCRRWSQRITSRSRGAVSMRISRSCLAVALSCPFVLLHD